MAVGSHAFSTFNTSVSAFISLFFLNCVFTALYKFMFLFANDKHGTGGCTHHAFGCAADAEVLPTGVAVRSDHDQIHG
jgi:hypothetical protein